VPARPTRQSAARKKGVVYGSGKITLATVEGVRRQFVAEGGSGHALALDDAEGGTGPKPIELALLALGGCTAFDVIGILRKKRQEVTGYEIELLAEQREEPPNYFTRVEIRHKLRGAVDPEAVQRAIELSETKYCSVGAMISKTARIESTFEIVLEGEMSPVA
jgi:putative redox protein